MGQQTFGESQPDEDVDGDGTALSYNLRFPGQYYDGETGKHYNFNRDYDPVTGRYVQSDPIGLDGGINLFSYAGNSPLINTDLNGLFCLPCVPVVIGDIIVSGGTVAGGITATQAVIGGFVTAAVLTIPGDTGTINHRGRIQIQNNSGYETSRSWASTNPPSSAEGTIALGELWAGLAIANKKMRQRLEACGAFLKAEAFILSGTKYAPLSKSFTCSPNQNDGERIDFEIIVGTAF